MNKAKQEAERLVERFYHYANLTERQAYQGHTEDYNAKQCALICLERECAGRIDELAKISEYLPEDIHFQADFSLKKKYNQVKQAIQEL